MVFRYHLQQTRVLSLHGKAGERQRCRETQEHHRSAENTHWSPGTGAVIAGWAGFVTRLVTPLWASWSQPATEELTILANARSCEHMRALRAPAGTATTETSRTGARRARCARMCSDAASSRLWFATISRPLHQSHALLAATRRLSRPRRVRQRLSPRLMERAPECRGSHRRAQSCHQPSAACPSFDGQRCAVWQAPFTPPKLGSGLYASCLAATDKDLSSAPPATVAAPPRLCGPSLWAQPSRTGTCTRQMALGPPAGGVPSASPRS